MSNRLKLCVVTTVPGTLESFVLEFAKYANEKAEWDITLVCDVDEKFAAIVPPSIRYVPIKMKRGISLDVFRVVGQLAQLFKHGDFDIVQYSTPNASLYASIAAFLARVPVRLYCQWGMAYVGFSGMKRAIFKRIEKTVCFLSTWIEPDSRSNLEFSHEEGLYPPQKGSVVWNGSACGVDLTKFDKNSSGEYRGEIREKLGIPKTAVVFGFVGRITRDKGINELLEASRMILDGDEQTYLLLIGNSEMDDSVRKDLYEWSERCDRVIYAGYTNCVEKYMAAMDCYVLPSYREGFGMAVVEAEAMGLPVIVSDIPGPIDAMIPDETGILVKKADVNSLYSAMRTLRDDSSLRSRFGEAAAAFARENFEQKRLFKMIMSDRLSLAKNASMKCSK